MAFSAYQKTVARNRERLVGVRGIERNVEGAVCRLHMDLKPDGEVVVFADAAFQGRTAFNRSSGKWVLTNSRFSVTFTNSDLPIYNIGQDYGGRISTPNNTTLTYKSLEGPKPGRECARY